MLCINDNAAFCAPHLSRKGSLESTEKVPPPLKNQNEKCLQFITVLSKNCLNKAIINRKRKGQRAFFLSLTLNMKVSLTFLVPSTFVPCLPANSFDQSVRCTEMLPTYGYSPPPVTVYIAFLLEISKIIKRMYQVPYCTFSPFLYIFCSVIPFHLRTYVMRPFSLLLSHCPYSQHLLLKT